MDRVERGSDRRRPRPRCNVETGAHSYTAEDDERDYVQQHFPQFIDEGIRYAVYPAVPRR